AGQQQHVLVRERGGERARGRVAVVAEEVTARAEACEGLGEAIVETSARLNRGAQQVIGRRGRRVEHERLRARVRRRLRAEEQRRVCAQLDAVETDALT